MRPSRYLAAAAEREQEFQKREVRWLAQLKALESQVAATWLPISEAVEGELVVVGWRDPLDTEHPDRHRFDWLEDGCWHEWHEHAEYVEMIGGHGVSYTPPYTHFKRLGALPIPSPGSVEKS